MKLASGRILCAFTSTSSFRLHEMLEWQLQHFLYTSMKTPPPPQLQFAAAATTYRWRRRQRRGWSSSIPASRSTNPTLMSSSFHLSRGNREVGVHLKLARIVGGQKAFSLDERVH